MMCPRGCDGGRARNPPPAGPRPHSLPRVAGPRTSERRALHAAREIRPVMSRGIDSSPMSRLARLLATLVAAASVLLSLAPVAMAADGVGLWGRTDDKVVTYWG